MGSSFFVQETNDFNLYKLARNVDICLYSLTQAIDGSGWWEEWGQKTVP